MADVEMPALGESVTEGTVTQWLKAEGDQVEVDEPLLEVSTDKVDTEIPSPVAGVLEKIIVAEDETVEVGAVLATIGDGPVGGSDAPAAEPKKEEPASTQPKPAQSTPEPATAQEPKSAAEGGSGDGTTVEMPALGESVTEGTVTQWLKAVGDQVEVDEPLLEVSTDKVDTEIPSPVAGTIQEILVGEDETVEVGGALAVIGDGAAPADPGSGMAPSAPTQAAEPQRAEQPKPAPQPEPTPQQAPAGSSGGSTAEPRPVTPPQAAPAPTSDADRDPAYVVPLVRKLAKEHGIDLATVQGTGAGGRIRKHDVLAAAEAAQQAAAQPQATPAAQQAPAQTAARPAASGAGSQLAAKRGTKEPMSRLRKVIASRMVESLQVSAQLTTVVEADVTKVARLRQEHKAEFQSREGVKLSFMPFFALAAIEALKEFPTVNASVEDDSILYHPQENLGIAVDTPRGLLVPVIKDAGDLNIAGLARKIDDLAARTRDNKVTPDELSGGTFTLTNTGSRGALFDTPIINQPQVGILGTGTVVERPVVVQDSYGSKSIAVRSMVYLALTYDHRVVDGADAARFLSFMKDRLEDGAFEV